MPNFIPARGHTLHLAGVCVNRIATFTGAPRVTRGRQHLMPASQRIRVRRSFCRAASLHARPPMTRTSE